ncbi:hypothetical protein BD626DRAFT_536507 [Schizophyllum amplum]|uniref:Uncharacterized protein n=1 Tax=Schizophyllum amplum TaxID=97359 RepID=A0A550CIF0_9AGAR|nr:hypothetical protein BD626DRAFT_536507 [Auriculariopsis ampla]
MPPSSPTRPPSILPSRRRRQRRHPSRAYIEVAGSSDASPPCLTCSWTWVGDVSAWHRRLSRAGMHVSLRRRAALSSVIISPCTYFGFGGGSVTPVRAMTPRLLTPRLGAARSAAILFGSWTVVVCFEVVVGTLAIITASPEARYTIRVFDSQHETVAWRVPSSRASRGGWTLGRQARHPGARRASLSPSDERDVSPSEERGRAPRHHHCVLKALGIAVGDEYMDRLPASETSIIALNLHPHDAFIIVGPSLSSSGERSVLGDEYMDRRPASRPLIPRHRRVPAVRRWMLTRALGNAPDTRHALRLRPRTPPPSDEATYRRPASRICARACILSMATSPFVV